MLLHSCVRVAFRVFGPHFNMQTQRERCSRHYRGGSLGLVTGQRNGGLSRFLVRRENATGEKPGSGIPDARENVKDSRFALGN